MAFATRLCVLCIAAIATITPSAARAQNAGPLLARMRAVNGTPYRMHVRSTFHSVEDGASVTTVTDSLGGKFSTQTCAQSLCTGVYFDGTTFARVDFNGTALPDSQLDTPLAHSLQDVESLEFLSPTFRGTIRDVGSTTVDGRPCRLLRIVPRGGLAINAAVDERTALLASVTDPRARDDARVYGDYRKVGSFVMPFAMRYRTMTVHYASRAIESGALVAPAGLRVRLTDAAPMRTEPNDVTPIGPCTIGGIAARCLIDTGNSGMSIGLQLAERLNLAAIGGGETHGLGAYATEVVRAGELSIGNAVVEPANYTVLPGIERNGYDVVVGTDALAATRVLIDPRAHLVRFGAPQMQDATVLALSFLDFVPVVNARLGDIAANLLLDTGDQSSIDLSSDFYAAHPDAFVPTRERGVSGIGGNSTQLLGRAPYVALGDLVLRDQPIGATRGLGGPTDGHLGAGFLTQFSLVLDYPSRRVELKDLARPGVVSIAP